MNSFITWIGGKKQLREAIVSRFPQEGIRKYVEVFGGAGWVLFHRDKHAPKEVYNDINSNLVNPFRMMKHHTEEVVYQDQRYSRCIEYEINNQGSSIVWGKCKRMWRKQRSLCLNLKIWDSFRLFLRYD